MRHPPATRHAFAVALLASLTVAPAAIAAPAVELDAPTLLAFGVKLEADGKKQEAAQAYRALEADPNSEIRSEARFRLAKILAAEGRIKEAAVLLRHVIDDHPRAAPPRLELVTLLQQLGDDSGTLRELRSLGTLDLPLNVARLVDRMSASLRSSQPLTVQVEMALAPDTNINRATRSNSLGTVFGDFILDRDAKARSGIGVASRSFIQGRLNLSPSAALKAHASLDADVYRDHDFNDIALELGAGPEFRRGPLRFAVEAGAGQQWYGMKAFQRNFRLSGSAWAKIDRYSQLRIDASARWANNQFNDLQDGRGMTLAARYERALSPRLTVSLGASADRFKATDEAYSTRSWTFAASAYREVGRTTLEVGGELGLLRADDRLALLLEKRQDRLARFRLGAVFRQLTVAGFAPTVRLVVERNRSTVEYYDYRRTRTEFGISRAF